MTHVLFLAACRVPGLARRAGRLPSGSAPARVIPSLWMPGPPRGGTLLEATLGVSLGVSLGLSGGVAVLDVLVRTFWGRLGPGRGRGRAEAYRWSPSAGWAWYGLGPPRSLSRPVPYPGSLSLSLQEGSGLPPCAAASFADALSGPASLLLSLEVMSS